MLLGLNFSESDSNRIWALSALALWFFTCLFQMTGSHFQPWHLYLSCYLCVVWIRVDFEWYQELKLVQKTLNKNVSLQIVILHLIHQWFYWTYHDYLKWMILCLMDIWWRQFYFYFVYQVCVINQLLWTWLTSNAILLDISKWWGLEKYVK